MVVILVPMKFSIHICALSKSSISHGISIILIAVLIFKEKNKAQLGFQCGNN
jgi:hypothetical protein